MPPRSGSGPALVPGGACIIVSGDYKSHDGEDALSKHLVHAEHANLVDVEDLLHFIVTDDLPFIGRILQVLLLDVDPYMLDRLWS